MKTGRFNLDEWERFLIEAFLSMRGKKIYWGTRTGHYYHKQFMELYTKVMCGKISPKFPMNRYKDKIINQIHEKIKQKGDTQWKKKSR